MTGFAGSVWGVTGISCLLGFAIVRLTPVATSIFSTPLSARHWLALCTSLLFFAYFEGYKGFQKGFSPRAAARMKYLYTNPRLLNSLLAPLFCMGFFGTTRRRQVASIVLTIVIVGFIIGVRLLPQPWRGIIDAGVIAGLSWGLASMWVFIMEAISTDSFKHSPEVPDET